jgi:hypothetical protein
MTCSETAPQVLSDHPVNVRNEAAGNRVTAGLIAFQRP